MQAVHLLPHLRVVVAIGAITVVFSFFLLPLFLLIIIVFLPPSTLHLEE